MVMVDLWMMVSVSVAWKIDLSMIDDDDIDANSVICNPTTTSQKNLATVNVVYDADVVAMVLLPVYHQEG